MRNIVLAALALVALVSCGSDDSSSTGGGTGGAAATGGAAGTGGATATGGAAGMAGASGTGGAAGSASDPRALAASLATDTIHCTQDSDCCVVFDMCRNEGYVVSSTDKAQVAGLLGSAPKDMCTGCIPPAIQVSCGASGFCTGVKVDCASSLFNDGMTDHCGSLNLPAGCSVVTQSGPLDPPGLTPKVILGCGP